MQSLGWRVGRTVSASILHCGPLTLLPPSFRVKAPAVRYSGALRYSTMNLTLVLQRYQIFSTGGGFVFNPIHNIQAGTPVENIVAMLDAVHEFNGVTHG